MCRLLITPKRPRWEVSNFHGGEDYAHAPCKPTYSRLKNQGWRWRLRSGRGSELIYVSGYGDILDTVMGAAVLKYLYHAGKVNSRTSPALEVIRRIRRSQSK